MMLTSTYPAVAASPAQQHDDTEQRVKGPVGARLRSGRTYVPEPADQGALLRRHDAANARDMSRAERCVS